MQEVFDKLHERSRVDALSGVDLYGKIVSRENILLAYRNVKSNTGSKTAGTDGVTIKEFKNISENSLVKEIRTYLTDYKPGKVRRVHIPKGYDKGTRPLGIPTMVDRVIQQMILQILDPIVEAKFYRHSYGFRTNRSTRHAIARSQSLINKNGLHYVVDVDIKGFFDNVNHSKLLKQLYSIGVKDKRVLRIISKMLKAPIEGEGIPNKGTPQGGILSPLLSNVVLNDLDHWVRKQWEGMDTKHTYSKWHKYRAMKTTKLKEMFIVRYADDFKIFTRDHKTAFKIYHAVKGYLKNNLKLDISEEKSKVTNLRRNKSSFLGYDLKAVKKKDNYVANTHVSDSNLKKIQRKAKDHIKKIQKNPNPQNVRNYNSYIIGLKNYFKYATHVHGDFNRVAYHLSRTIHNRLKQVARYGVPVEPSDVYKRYHKTKSKTYEIMDIHLHLISDTQTVNNMNFSQSICDYTEEGREKIKRLSRDVLTELHRMIKVTHDTQTVEYTDNRLSKYSMQKGNCSVTGEFLYSEDVHCHHIKPKSLGGTDEFKNLTIVSKLVHRLIHATSKETIERYLGILKLSGKQLEKVNKYRKKCNLLSI